MALKHLLLSLDSGDGSIVRCNLAIQLAKAHDSHITGLYVRDSSSSQGIPGGMTVGLSEPIRQSILAQRDRDNQEEVKAIDRFTGAVRGADITFDHHVEDDFAGWGAVPHLVRYAHTADLVIIDKAAEGGRDIAHDVLFGGGVPVLVVPRIPQSGIGHHVTIAWNGSREAARAVKDALPILQRAARVTVLCINQADRERNSRPGDDLVEHLEYHGIQSTTDSIASNGRSVGDAIVSRIADEGADMLVMGAWGHSRLHEFVLGGVTRSILARTAVPVLMSH
jgi:nucleotide-binding universal stress UspA family protein